MTITPSLIAPAEPALVQPDLAGTTGAELWELDDRELLAIAGSLPHSGDRRAAARDLLVSRHRALVYSCVRRYLGGPEPAEDLVQVGYLGLVKAINNFDPAFGYGLSSYARAYILGEIKRHFRDKRWQLHVERPMQELVLHVRETTERLTHELGRAPADVELAGDLRVSVADIREAHRAELVLHPKSLDEPAASQGGPPSLA